MPERLVFLVDPEFHKKFTSEDNETKNYAEEQITQEARSACEVDWPDLIGEKVGIKVVPCGNLPENTTYICIRDSNLTTGRNSN